MSDEIKTNKPDVGIKGNPKSVEPYQSSETLRVTSGVPNFQGAFTQLAMTNDAFSTITEQVAIAGSQALAQKWGYEAGLNPSGNPYPAITNFDKAFNQSYLSQAQDTLSLKANELLINGQDELAKAPRLNKDLIKSYAENMQQGLSELYESAPDAIKGNLELNYQTKLMQSAHSLNNKMVDQQRSEAKDLAHAQSIIQQQNVFDTALAGNFEAAKAMTQNSIDLIKKNEEAGLITHTQAAQEVVGLKRMLITAQKTQEANQLRKLAVKEKIIHSQTRITKAELLAKTAQLKQIENNLVDNFITEAEKAKHEGQLEVYLQSLVNTSIPGLNHEAMDKIITRVEKHFKPEEYVQNKIRHEANEARKEAKHTTEQNIQKIVDLQTEKGISLKRTNQFENFMAGLFNSLPNELPIAEKIEIISNVAKNLKTIESQELRQQDLLIAQFNNKLARNDPITTQDLNDLDNVLTREQALKAKTNFIVTKTKRDAKTKSLNEVIRPDVWTSPQLMADQSPSAINAGFQSLSQRYQQEHQVSDMESKVAIAQTAGIPIPQFTDEINAMLMSGRGDLMEQASGAYSVLGKLKLPISQTAHSMLSSYQSQKSQGATEPDAAFLAKAEVAPKNEEQQKIIKSRWKEYAKQHNLSNYSDQERHARKLLDIPWFTQIPNMAAVTQTVNKAFEANFYRFNTDTQAAVNLTKENLKMAFGVTYANGFKQFTQFPVENFLGISTKEAGAIIQKDMAAQAALQLKATKDAFDKHNFPFYYQIKDMPSYEQAIEAKLKRDELLNKSGSLVSFGIGASKEALNEPYELNQIVNNYLANKPIVVEQIFKGGHKEEFELVFVASNTLGLSLDPTLAIVGGYDINLRTKSGGITALQGVDNLAHGNASYLPNLEKLKQQYYALVGIEDPVLKEARDKVIAVAREKFYEKEINPQKLTKFRGH